MLKPVPALPFGVRNGKPFLRGDPPTYRDVTWINETYFYRDSTQLELTFRSGGGILYEYGPVLHNLDIEADCVEFWRFDPEKGDFVCNVQRISRIFDPKTRPVLFGHDKHAMDCSRDELTAFTISAVCAAIRYAARPVETWEMG